MPCSVSSVTAEAFSSCAKRYSWDWSSRASFCRSRMPFSRASSPSSFSSRRDRRLTSASYGRAASCRAFSPTLRYTLRSPARASAASGSSHTRSVHVRSPVPASFASRAGGRGQAEISSGPALFSYIKTSPPPNCRSASSAAASASSSRGSVRRSAGVITGHSRHSSPSHSSRRDAQGSGQRGSSKAGGASNRRRGPSRRSSSSQRGPSSPSTSRYRRRSVQCADAERMR